MPLPDISRFRELTPDAWRSLGARLRAIGFDADTGAPFARLAQRAADPLRAPMAKWHARRVREPGAYAMRMLMFWDPVTPDEARAVLGEEHSLDRMLAAGFLRRQPDGGIVSPFVTNVAGDAFVLCDDVRSGGEAVMGLGPTTIDLIRAARPRAPVGSALDLGCGAGAAALALAPLCGRVVATDINPRAIDLARVNAWLSGIGNVEFRLGDLFAPVAGETFDLVVSQPPFIAHHDSGQSATFMFGGARGDELPLRVFRELPPHLAHAGLAVVLVEWPLGEGDPPLEARVREAVGASPELSVLVVQSTETDLDDHCASYARVDGPAEGTDRAAGYEQAAIRYRDHFDRMKIGALRLAFNVIRRSPQGAGGWTSTVQARSLREVDVRRARLDAIMAARDLLTGGTRALLGARLRVTEGATFSQAQTGRAGVLATLPREALVAPLSMNEATAALVTRVHEAENVKAAIERFAADQQAPVEAIAQEALAGVRHALLYGLLEVG